MQLAAGEAHRLPREAREAGYAPLLNMGLPPQPLDWQFDDVEFVEGDFDFVTDGYVYGDGSGYFQDDVSSRIATWSIVRMADGGDDGMEVEMMRRGSIGGWCPTVPRGELRALIEFLRYGSLTATFVGDCRYVVDGVASGVSAKLRSSTSIDADLWRMVHSLICDHGAIPRVIKTKAHRSRTRAALDQDDGLHHWRGNQAADQAAKSLARSRALAHRGPDIRTNLEHFSIDVICRVAQGAALAVERWPDVAPRGDTRRGGDRRQLVATANGDCDQNHIVRRMAKGGFECAVCKRLARTAAGARRMAGATCGGAISPSIHQTHSLCRSHGLTWCGTCGAYSARWPRRLLEPCNGRPRSQAQRNVLRRLLTGLQPTTAAYLDEVAAASGRPQSATDDVQVMPGHGSDHRCLDQHHHAPHRPQQPAGQRMAEAADPGAEPGVRDDGAGRCRPLQQARAHGYKRLEESRKRQKGDTGGVEPRAMADRAPAGVAVTPRVSEPRLQVSDCTDALVIPHWSRRAAATTVAAPIGCNICGDRTKLRCRGCQGGLCLACAKLKRPCRVSVASRAHEFSSHHHDHHRTAGEADSSSRVMSHTSPPVAAPRVSVTASSSSGLSHSSSPVAAPRVSMAASSSSALSHTPVPMAVSGICHHQRHHQGCPEASLPEVPHTSHPNVNRAEHQNSRQNTLQVDEANQRTVVVAAPLTSSVSSPLSQGLCPVVVAAEAAVVSHENGPPLQRHKCHADGVADCIEVSPTTSLSAAAASSSNNWAYL